MALVRAAAFRVLLQTKAVAVRIFVGEFLALTTVDCFAHCLSITSLTLVGSTSDHLTSGKYSSAKHIKPVFGK